MKNIFISSTFRDMQEERDLILERVFPELRKEAKKYGDSVGMIDLRWGVDTSKLETDAGSAKVLKVCLDEIDRSHPYMLIFLGERYGWIPQKELIEEAVRGREGKFITNDFEKSVTALEIEYGALSDQYGELEKCIICIREPIGKFLSDKEKEYYIEQEERGREKLRKLKEKIYHNTRMKGQVISYSAVWNTAKNKLVDFQADGKPLEDVLVKRFIEMFQEDWIEYGKLSWQEKEQLSFRALTDSKVRSFAGREAILEEYYEDVVNGKGTLVLRGKVGCGKTAILCKLSERLQMEGKHVFNFFAGTSAKSTNAEHLVRQMVYYMESLLGTEEYWGEREEEERNLVGEFMWQLFGRQKRGIEYAEWLERLQELCLKIPMGEEVFFCIDSLDELFPDEHIEKMDFLTLEGKVHIIASCADFFELPMNIIKQGEVKDVRTLEEKDTIAVAEGILQFYSRNKYDAIEQEMLRKTDRGNALYVSLLVQRLNMLDGEELRNAPNEEDIVALGVEAIRQMPDELEEAIVAIIQNGVKKVTEDTYVLEDALRYLAVTRRGLRISDLQELLNVEGQAFQILDFTLLVKYLDSIFYMHEDGWIDFSHKGIRQVLLKKMKNRAVYEEAVKEHIAKLETFDKLRNQEGMYFARIRKDEFLATRLAIDALIMHSSELYKIFAEEALADEGIFYAQLIRGESQEESSVCNCFTVGVLGMLGNSERELKARINIAKALVLCKESVYNEYKTDKSMEDLRVSYNYMRRTLKDSGHMNDALDFGLKALTLTEILYEKNREEFWEDLMYEYGFAAHTLFELQRMNESQILFKKKLEYVYRRYKKDKTIDNLAELAGTYFWVSQSLYMEICISDEVEDRNAKLQEALYHSKKALTYAKILYDKQKSDGNLRFLIVCYNQVGNNLYISEQELDALEHYKKEWEYGILMDDSLGDIKLQKQVADHLLAAGNSLRKMGKVNEALEYYKVHLQCQERMFEKEGCRDSWELLLQSSDRIVSILYGLKQYKEILCYAEKSISYAERLYVQNPIDSNLEELSRAYNNYGMMLCEENNMEKAVKYLEKAVLLKEEVYQAYQTEDNVLKLLSRQRNLIVALLDFRCPELAVEYARKAVMIGKTAYERDDSERIREAVMKIELAYADVLLELGYIEQSLELYQKKENYSKSLYEKTNTIVNTRSYSKLLKGIYLCYLKLDKHQEAEMYYPLAVEVATKLYEQSNGLWDKKLLEEIKNMK